ncbi:MAG: hypothetical protein ACYDC5_11990, partial [Candidatus Dormibacteria bacterium]
MLDALFDLLLVGPANLGRAIRTLGSLPRSRVVRYRLTVLGSHPTNRAAVQAHRVRSNASIISMISP